MQFDEILTHFQIQKRYGDKAQARCPCHEDKQASLTISKGRRSALLHCHAGCNFENIIRAVGRFTYGLGGKHRKDLKSVYGNLKALNKAISEGKPIFIPEGEKDVDTLTERGYTAITYGGSGDWQSEFATLFKTADVYILADNDEPGRKVANAILSDLKGIAKSATVIVPVPDIPKADISDYFAAGHSREDFENLLKESVTENRGTGERNLAPTKKHTLVDKLIELDAANKYPLTDIGSASLFSAVFKDKHRYNVTAKDWFFYDGQRWILDREGLRARKSAKELSKALSVYAVNHLPDEDEKKKEQYLKYALTWTYSRKTEILTN